MDGLEEMGASGHTDGLEDFFKEAGVREPARTQYLVKFRNENIDIDVLPRFNETELAALGCKAGDVKRIMWNIEKKKEVVMVASTSSDITNLSERVISLEKDFVDLRLRFNLIILRDGVWRINKNLGRSQYENTPMVANVTTLTPSKQASKEVSSNLKRSHQQTGIKLNHPRSRMKRKR